jgi:hypothetical protein
MKQKANVYLNVTWTGTMVYEAKRKCLCECYMMNWNYKIWSKKQMFIWMLHELKLWNMKQKGNVYVNVTWIETIEYEAKRKCLHECYMNWTIEYDEAKRKCLCKCYMNRIWPWIMKQKDLFMWMLHELKLKNMKQKGNVYLIWSEKQMFIWMLHELKL